MLLRKGSKGEEVKILQFMLSIPADGVFGPQTEMAVKKFQQENKLTVDGIVGPNTMRMLGMLSTDVEEINNDSEGLKIYKHYLPCGEYFAENTKKEWLFLHHTAGWQDPYQTINIWAKDKIGKIATEFVLGGQSVKGNNDKFDGEVVQAFPDGCYAWHLGACSRDTHKKSVGIEVCNFGSIKNGKTWAGVVAHESQIVELSKPFRGNKFWHRYSDKQIESLKELILYICKRDNIDPRKGLVELIHSKGADAFDHYDPYKVQMNRGIWSHTNVRKDKVDMFPQQELIDMLLSL
jgi:hypothetical protein